METELEKIEAALLAIGAVASAWTDLGYFGFKCRDTKNFSEDRTILFSKGAGEEFVLATRWFEMAIDHRTLGPSRGSYALKHVAEEFAGHYISNGMLIAAAIHMGLKVRRWPEGPNAEISIPATLSRKRRYSA